MALPVALSPGDTPDEGFLMVEWDEQRGGPPDPDPWALDQARDEQDDEQDSSDVDRRARDLMREHEDERHTEYDDPDEGGEG
jgi:hypothetical protein